MKRISETITCIVLAALLLSACTPTADPQPRARFQGDIDLGGFASNATISFSISEDGTTLEFLTIEVNNLDCDYLSAEKILSTGYIGIPIENGVFSNTIPPSSGALTNFTIKEAAREMPDVSKDRPGSLSGSFSTPTEASGEIHLYLYIPTWGDFELGTFKWSASAE